MAGLWLLGSLIVVFLILAVLGWKMGDSDYPAIGATVFVLSVLGTIFFSIWLLVATISYIGSPVKAALLNKTYGTNYTAEELFWGDSIIESVIQGDRHRIDLTTKNGDGK